MPRSVCIVGCGFSGIAASRVFDQFGYDITVYEKAPDVGGVWSKTRSYPGLGTQNVKSTYYLSEMPMPASYPDWPSGPQVQAYLDSYVDRFDLRRHISVNTEVVEAVQDDASKRWTVTTRPCDGNRRPLHDAKTTSRDFDILLVCNGTFSDGMIPDYKGLAEFTEAGGKLVHTSDFLDAEEARGKNVIIVGYGKSACDSAVALSQIAASTTVVARKLIWKLPKFIAGLCYSYLFLGRVGEALFEYIRPTPVMRVLHGPLRRLRNAMVGSVEWLVTRQLKLKGDTLPPGRFEDIARASISLVTESFFERVESGDIKLKRDTEIVRLVAVESGDHDGSSRQQPSVELSNGEVIPADIVSCGTGFHQRVPFLNQDRVMSQITDEKGNFLLHRFINPPGIDNLFFIGYNSSLFCPTSFEVAALWVVAILEGTLELPPVEEQRQRARAELDWMQDRTRGKHSRGTNVVPFSLHNIDDMLGDLKLDISTWSTLSQWLLPVNPSSYRFLAEEMLKKRLRVRKEL